MRLLTKNTETRTTNQDVTFSTVTNFLTGSQYTSARSIDNADVFTAIQMISSDIASLPLEKHNHGVKEYHDKLSTLFNVRPNQYYNAYQLKFIMVANALLNGESFVEIVRDKNGVPTELFHVKNSDVSIKQDQTTRYKLVYEVANGKKVRRIKSGDMLHFKFFSLDGVRGISPLNSLRDDIDTQSNSKRFLSNFFKNGTSGSGILTYKGGKLNKEARDKLKHEWQKANAGTDEAHKVLVLDDTMEYEDIQIDTEILKLINTSTHSTTQVAKAFRIPRHKFGLETVNMNLEQMNLDYLISTLQPYLESITNEIGFKMVKEHNVESVRYKFNTDNYKTIDSETKVKNTRNLLEMGVINLDEARQEFGKDALEDDMGRKHLVSLNYTTLTNLEEIQLSKARNFPIPKPPEGKESSDDSEEDIKQGNK